MDWNNLYYDIEAESNYIKWLEIQGYSNSTMELYKNYYNKIKDQFLTQVFIDNFLLLYRSRSARDFFKNYLKFLRRKDLEVYPTRYKKRKPANYLTKDQIEYILNNTTGKTRILVKMLFETGLRAGEIVKIKVRDVDFLNCRIKGFGKRNKPYDILISNDLRDELFTLCATKTPEKSLFGFGTRQALNKRFTKDITNKLDLKVHPHLFRHSFCTYLYNNGLDLMKLKELSRHEKIDTLSIYVHANKDQAERQYNKIFNGYIVDEDEK